MCQCFGTSIPFGIDFLGCCIGRYIKAPASVEHACERLCTEYPNCPCTLDLVEHIGVVVDYPCLAMQIPAMEGGTYLSLQGRKIFLDRPVEINQFFIGIVYNLNLRRPLGKKYSRTAYKRFAIEPVPGYQRDDTCSKFLFATVIADGGS